MTGDAITPEWLDARLRDVRWKFPLAAAMQELPDPCRAAIIAALLEPLNQILKQGARDG